MATQRFISTSFWDDPWVQSLSYGEMFLYLYLLTNPLTNIAGIYEIADRRISFDTKLTTRQIHDAMKKFNSAGKAVRIGTWVILPSWPKHQRWEKSDRIQTGIESILKTLPHKIINSLNSIGYQYPTDRVNACVNTTTYPLCYTDTDTDLDTDSDCIVIPKSEPRAKFKKPTVQEVADYAAEINFNLDAQYFIDHYISNGWTVGKAKMKDWKATVRKWKQRDGEFKKNNSSENGNGLKMFGSE